MLKEGIILGERYEVIARIGTGGMADVYKAQDHKLNRLVAVKVMKAEFREDTSFVSKFQKEAQSAARLSHPNVVNVYDVGEDRGLYYIVMELIEGITLKNYIAKKGKLSVKEATSIAIQVSLGLEAAHNRGIIHRDVKPQNIIISTDGKVKLSDFGIAKAINSNTITANVMGSVHYSSPEQVRGGFSDAKSDIYSLGITMYEMVTGRVPFDGDSTVAIAIKHLQEEIVPPSIYTPDLPYSMEQIILKCTQKNPERRYMNTGELIEDLKRSLIDPQGDFVSVAPLAAHSGSAGATSQDVERVRKTYTQNSRRGTTDARAERRRQREEEYEIDNDDDDDEDEDEPSSGLEKIITIGGFLIGAVIIVILIAVLGNMAGIFHFGRNAAEGAATSASSAAETSAQSEEATSENANKVSVPNLIGMTAEAATETANAKGIGVRTAGSESSEEYAEGLVIRQNYNQGDLVDPGTTIEVIVSTGKADVIIPSGLVGMEQSAAESSLQGMGLVTTIELQFDDTIDVGYVIGTNPGEGASVSAGSTVVIYVSKGVDDTDLVTIPDILFWDEQDAYNTLTTMGLDYRTEYVEYDAYNDEIVIDISPSVGESVEKGTTVTLYVNDIPSGIFVCYSPLSRPEGYNGGNVKLELVQGDLITVLYEGEDPWTEGTYNQPIQSTSGEVGVINVYEDDTLIARYPNVTFEEE